MKSAWKITKIILIVLFCIEVVLHFYNPFTVKEDQTLTNLTENVKHELKDLHTKGLDSVLVHTKNKLGFRGPEWKEDEKGRKIICMGGSGTECFFLSDGKDWPNLLLAELQKNHPDIWLNNAGRTGNSVYDNLALLKKKILKLKPDYIYLMCGLDDIGRSQKKKISGEKSWFHVFYNFLELPKAFKAIFKNGQNSHQNNFEILDLAKAEVHEMSDTQILQRIAQEQPLISDYKKYLQEMVEICKSNDIKLILISQVILFADEKDPVSDVRLGNLKIGDINGRTEALLLKQYNKATFEIADSNSLTFINLSARLPKDSRYFYDGFHFTKDGAEMVAHIIFDESKDLIKK